MGKLRAYSRASSYSGSKSSLDTGTYSEKASLFDPALSVLSEEETVPDIDQLVPAAAEALFFDAEIQPVYYLDQLAGLAYVEHDDGSPLNLFVLGRDWKSWLTLILFYSCHVGGIVLFGYALENVYFHSMLNKNIPPHRLGNSYLSDGYGSYSEDKYHGNPGLGFRPLLADDSNLLRFIASPDHPESWAHYSGTMSSFLKQYEEGSQHGCQECDFDGPVSAAGVFCCFYPELMFDTKECHRHRSFGYPDGQPCIFLKINRIYGWEPLLYNSSNVPSSVKDRFREGHIPIECRGITPIDQEMIQGVTYYPETGIPAYHFPYMNQIRYKSPMVAVQFNVTPGVIVMIECVAHARNIEVDGPSMTGATRLELMVDSLEQN